MAIPFTVDISAFYGEPDFREQDSGTIVDRRKTLNLHKELEAPVQTKRGKKSPPQRKKRGATKRTSAKSDGTNAANNAINKGVNYVNNKTGSDTVKQLANVRGDMAKGTVSDVANQISGKGCKGFWCWVRYFRPG